MSNKCVFLSFFLCYIYTTTALDNIHDELLWTKCTWNDYKIIKPQSKWRVAEEPIVTQETERLITKGYDYISLIGPSTSKDISDNIENGLIDLETESDGDLSKWISDLFDDFMTSTFNLIYNYQKSN